MRYIYEGSKDPFHLERSGYLQPSSSCPSSPIGNCKSPAMIGFQFHLE